MQVGENLSAARREKKIVMPFKNDEPFHEQKSASQLREEPHVPQYVAQYFWLI